MTRTKFIIDLSKENGENENVIDICGSKSSNCDRHCTDNPFHIFPQANSE
jgi:hypothetical protein